MLEYTVGQEEKTLPEVSVIVPIYRAKPYIAPCVRALKRQGLKDIEILLVDDCSPDDTYEYASDMFRDDPMVRVLRQEKNGGPGKARNRGIREAGGNYVGFCDVDDLYVDGALAGMFREAEKLNADVFCTKEFYLTAANPLPEDLSTLKEENLLKSGFLTREESMQEGRVELAGSIEERLEKWFAHLHHWSVFGKLFRTDFLREADVYFSDLRLGEDHLFVMKALLKAGIYAEQVSSPYIYRTGDVSSVSRGGKDPGVFLNAMNAIFESVSLIDEALEGIPFFEEHPEYIQRLKKYHIRRLEEGFAVPKYQEIGRESLSSNEAVSALFSRHFGNKGSFVEETLFDAYDGRKTDTAFESFFAYDNLKKLREQSEFFSFLQPAK